MLQETLTPRFPPIENMILTGIQQSLEHALGIEQSKILFVASTDRLKLAAQLAKMRDGPAARIEWPLLFLHLQSVGSGMEEGKHAFNPKSLSRHGVYTQMDDSQGKVRKINLIPTVFEFEVVYMVDNFGAAFAFANNWVAQAHNNRANFSLTYGSVPIDIKVEMALRVSTPDAEASVDQPNVFEYSTSLAVVGYVSDPHPNGESDIQVLRKPVVKLSLDDEAKPDPKVWSGRHVMPILRNKP